MTTVWDGIIDSKMLEKSGIELQKNLADAAKSCDWTTVIDVIGAQPDFVNITRPDG